jgi:biotin carboxyl carrier protein
VEDATHDLTLSEWTGSGAVISGDTDRMELALQAVGTRIYAGWGSSQAVIADVSLQAAVSAGAAGHKLLRAPMAGRIVSLSATVGQTVEKGAVLLALEAMKMEHPALAPMAATVTAVHVALGAQVTAGAPLVDLEPLAG